LFLVNLIEILDMTASKMQQNASMSKFGGLSFSYEIMQCIWVITKVWWCQFVIDSTCELPSVTTATDTVHEHHVQYLYEN